MCASTAILSSKFVFISFGIVKNRFFFSPTNDSLHTTQYTCKKTTVNNVTAFVWTITNSLPSVVVVNFTRDCQPRKSVHENLKQISFSSRYLPATTTLSTQWNVHESFYNDLLLRLRSLLDRRELHNGRFDKNTFCVFFVVKSACAKVATSSKLSFYHLPTGRIFTVTFSNVKTHFLQSTATGQTLFLCARTTLFTPTALLPLRLRIIQ